MRRIARALVLVSALVCAAPLLAEELSTAAIKAFIAELDAATERRDADTIVDRIAGHAVISGTVLVLGQTHTFRVNKAQYREMLTQAWAAASSYEHNRTNEKISLDGDQATITADVAETIVIQGQQIETKSRERATVESLDGRLMLTQVVINQIM
jgi:ketosteroid isomerase-like protein